MKNTPVREEGTTAKELKEFGVSEETIKRLSHDEGDAEDAPSVLDYHYAGRAGDVVTLYTLDTDEDNYIVVKHEGKEIVLARQADTAGGGTSWGQF